MIKIAIDVQGGDFSPNSPLEGANLFAKKNSEVEFLLFGDEVMLKEELKKFPTLSSCSRIFHSETVIKSGDKPSLAVRNGRDSSMWRSIESVRDNLANAVISSGNTGALMAFSKLVLKTLPNIIRPAIIGIMPNDKTVSAMLDLGANSDCDAEIIYQFALMGRAFAQAALSIENPKIGLLNIGSEEIKGNDSIRLANIMLRDSAELGEDFYGFIEGDDIARGLVDVIVADGFSGNIALKSIEGTAWLFTNYLKQVAKKSWLAKLGFFLARSSIKKIFGKFDRRLYNGAMFLGLNGIVIKSHGSADAVAFANAIKVGYDLAKNNINQQISNNLNHHNLIEKT